MIQDKLRELNIQYNRGHGSYRTTCPECSHTRRNKTQPCLSVTIDEAGAVWNCHHCSYNGSYNDKNSNNFIKPKIIKNPQVINYPTTVNHFKEFWISRKISEETVKHFDIKEVQKTFHSGSKWSLAFPYILKDKIVNYKYRTLDKDFRQEANSRRSLFNVDAIKNKKEIIFVEGEMDVLALYECGITNVVSLPDGAPKEAKFRDDDKRFDALKESAELLAKAEKVIIAVDMDTAGQALTQELAHRFGKDRCYLVDWNMDNKDANDALVFHGKDYVAEQIKRAKPYPIDGLYRAEEYKNQLLDLYYGKEEKAVTTGYTNLDSIYKLMTGTFTVLTGIPNHGKSNFLDQILINASKIHKWKFAIFSPEHSTPRHLSRLTEKYCEKPFNEGISNRVSRDELEESLKHLNEHFFFLESREERPTIEWVLEKARVACIRNGIKGIVIDPYNEVDTTQRGNKREDEYIRDIISQCKRFARTHDVCVWVVAHPAKLQRQSDGSYPVPTMYDISGSAHWNNMADIGLVVHRNFEDNTTSIHARKIREQGLYGDIGEALFAFDVEKRVYLAKESLDYYATDTNKNNNWHGD
jgi:twinkle protein|tara:strand:+ start:916 stop:2661 length:1746 start_codon:yes stop_codon:yes gene_type:complete